MALGSSYWPLRFPRHTPPHRRVLEDHDPEPLLAFSLPCNRYKSRPFFNRTHIVPLVSTAPSAVNALSPPVTMSSLRSENAAPKFFSQFPCWVVIWICHTPSRPAALASVANGPLVRIQKAQARPMRLSLQIAETSLITTPCSFMEFQHRAKCVNHVAALIDVTVQPCCFQCLPIGAGPSCQQDMHRCCLFQQCYNSSSLFSINIIG